MFGANYLLFFHDNEDQDANETAKVAQVEVRNTPGDERTAKRDASVDDFGTPVGRTLSGKLTRGQTVLKALRAEGIDSRSALPLIHAMEKVFDFRHALVGDSFEAKLSDDGQVTKLTYTQSPLEIYDVTIRDNNTYVATKRKVPTRVDVAEVGCTVKGGLYASIARCGEGTQLAAMLTDLFAWDVDFFHDLRTGDEFRVLVEKISVDDRFLKYGDIVAAQYRGKFGQISFVQFNDASGEKRYFTADGRGVRKQFLKSPLKYTRVSAKGYGGLRTSLHQAAPVIYTARKRTPVWAVASGTVMFAGESGSLGKAVTIRHDNGYTSTYGHLGNISRGLTVGARVSQKALLGKVGQTGKADAPQLLFSVRKDGALLNPFRLKFAESAPVSDAEKTKFGQRSTELLQDLDAIDVGGNRRG